jgi:hypothetical protein
MLFVLQSESTYIPGPVWSLRPSSELYIITVIFNGLLGCTFEADYSASYQHVLSAEVSVSILATERRGTPEAA